MTAFFGALLQYPASNGDVFDYRELVERFHAANALVAVAADLLALTLLTPPGEFGADVAIGSAQRFWRTTGLRWPARGLLRHPRCVQARHAGPLGRCFG